MYSMAAIPKLGKCRFCYTALNDYILSCHEKDCVRQLIRCPNCSICVLLKDAHEHRCKFANIPVVVKVNIKGFGRKETKLSEKVIPYFGKCSFCNLELNNNILQYHEKDCVHKPLRSSKPTMPVLIKSARKHHYKSEDNITEEPNAVFVYHQKDSIHKPIIRPNFSITRPEDDHEQSCNVTNRRDENKFMQGLKELLHSGQYSDIILKVKGKEFNVHKIVLAVHSPVFAAMMQHDTKEKATGIVEIEDNEPEIFAAFLEFLYSERNQIINPENVIDLYIVADKYQVTELSKACVTFMKMHISVETFCDIMSLSLRHHEKELTNVATKYFLQNSTAIAKTSKWLLFMKENLVAGNELFLKALELKR